MKHVTGHDLIKFGIIPELIGRLPVIAALSDLSEDDMGEFMKEFNKVVRERKQEIIKETQKGKGKKK